MAWEYADKEKAQCALPFTPGFFEMAGGKPTTKLLKY
jgi:hypothetical protein